MIEDVFSYLSQLDPFWIYVVLFFFAFIENFFPPSPSDLVVIMGAALIGSTSLGFVSVLLLTSFASAAGFVLMHLIGRFFGEKILRTGKIKFVTPRALARLDVWFSRYGYWLIIANRFLTGARSAISFFSGVHRLHLGKTFVCASLSALLWNTGIIYLGMTLGGKVELIDRLLSRYNRIALIIIMVVAAALLIKYLIKRRKNERNQPAA